MKRYAILNKETGEFFKTKFWDEYIYTSDINKARLYKRKCDCTLSFNILFGDNQNIFIPVCLEIPKIFIKNYKGELILTQEN